MLAHLPYIGGDQHIIHKMELSHHSHDIIKTNKNEVIKNLEEEIIIIKYRWQTHNKAILLLLDRLDTHQKLKEEKKKKKEEYKNKEKHKQVTFLLLVETME